MRGPVVDGLNYGDENMDGILNPGEMWYFQSMKIATEAGQHKNVAQVIAEDSGGTMVMDDDPSHYFIVNPIDIEKYVKEAQPDHTGDVCETTGKSTELTFEYIGGSDLMTNQGSKASVSGVPDDDVNGYFVVSSKEDPSGGKAKIYFSDAVAHVRASPLSSILKL